MSLVVHKAPLNSDCADPDTTCEFETEDVPENWKDIDFDEASWVPPTEFSVAEVGPKDGYEKIDWADSAHLIWGTDRYVDNTVLLRSAVIR